jgi:hypothetical protein
VVPWDWERHIPDLPNKEKAENADPKNQIVSQCPEPIDNQSTNLRYWFASLMTHNNNRWNISNLPSLPAVYHLVTWNPMIFTLLLRRYIDCGSFCRASFPSSSGVHRRLLWPRPDWSFPYWVTANSQPTLDFYYSYSLSKSSLVNSTGSVPGRLEPDNLCASSLVPFSCISLTMPLMPSSSLTFLEGNWSGYRLMPDPIIVSWWVSGTMYSCPGWTGLLSPY